MNKKEFKELDREQMIIAFNQLKDDYSVLFDELEQEKEKNKELEEKLKIATAMLTKGTYPEENEGDNDFDKQFIAVDKIKEKIEEVQAKIGNDCIALHDFQREAKIDVLKELLEEV